MHHVTDLYALIPTAMRTIDGFNQDTGMHEQPSKAENNYDQIDPAILPTYLMQSKALYSALLTAVGHAEMGIGIIACKFKCGINGNEMIQAPVGDGTTALTCLLQKHTKGRSHDLVEIETPQLAS